jgi:uncharacterized membrane protein (GlpM family)
VTRILIKVAISVGVIFAATAIGRKLPSAAGLIAVMPLTGALILVWMTIENRGDTKIMEGFTRGAFWGILPSALFYLVAFYCFRRSLPLPIVLLSSFGVWLGAAFLHQWLLK